MRKLSRHVASLLALVGALLAAPVAMAGTVTATPPNVVYPPAVAPLYPTGIGFNPVVDYTKPNFAQSPNIRKFIDSLPGLGAANKNNLGQYIPVAVPDQGSFPGSDYYEIGLKTYNQQMNSDLPATGTALRGYYQKNGPDPSTQYLGPAIIAKRNVPVRIRFSNELGKGTAGDLPLPVDTGIMGAGMGPTAGQNYNQNRADLHLHGGLTPWISDGTPHQWITPAGDPTVYPKGASFQNVPDMINASVVNGISVPCVGGAKCFTPTASDGVGTYYYPNSQSSRLMFYHDHAYGITRLNVYAGEAAPYLLVDPVEDDLIDGTNLTGGNPAGTQILPNLGGVYRYGIPLVIQDKAFVNDGVSAPSAAALAAFPDPVTGYVHTAPTLATDPLWQYWVGAPVGGNLWFPHEYMPIENIFDPTGNTPNGRYDYAPFMNPPMIPTNLTLPSPSIMPEAFVDTAVVNGTAYPYLELPPDAVRFRILNASNDRTLNLQLYKADPLRINVTNGGSGYSATPTVTITGNSGTFTSATASVSPGTIASIDVVGAAHYIFPPTVTLTGGGGTCTSVTATIPSNSSGLLSIDAQGCTGFTSAPTVTLTGGGGGTYTSATATIIPPGVITAIDVTGAAGYRSDQAAPVVTITDTTGVGATAVAFVNTEIKMVPAAPYPGHPTLPVDGRDGGMPDPTTAAPPWIQIGNEAGFLAQAAVWPQQPVVFEQSRQSIPTLGVTYRTLMLMPAMRADVVMDLSGYKDGDTLILYNDGPAPLPGYWAIDDYYTDDPDLTGVGGAPTTPAGFGPNTRTIMQIRIKGTKTSTFNFSQSAVQTALPKAFAVSQDKPLIPQFAYNDAFPGFATFDTYAQNYMDTLNLTGTAQPIARIKTVAPGSGYVVAPTVTIVGGGGTGATATAGLNPCGGVTLLTAGSGYTTPPTVTIGAPGAGGVQATAVATISGGLVTAITIDEPGSNYSTTVAPTCTVSAPTGVGGVAATCSTFVAAANTVGSITVTKPGTGYTSQPYVYLTGGLPGTGATAVALLSGAKVFTGKNLTEGFDPEYARMDVRLGSTPNPLTPSVGNGQVVGIARYIDPPTEFLNDGEVTLWRLTHLGVDSHAMHFHLFNLQVVNRVDFTNVVKPPYPDEIGWRETIRTNPMEDIIVAIKPVSMPLPFPLPLSNRLLDPTTPANSTTNFLPVAPPAGVAAVPQISNTMTNFEWEYVWHCHLLGHEENDMMRPLSFIPGNPVGVVAPTTLPFPSTTVATTSAALTVTLSNTATVGQSLFISKISLAGANAANFAQTNNCGASVPLGGSCTISVTFTPSAVGNRTASLSIATDDPVHPTLTVALSGTGLSPTPPAPTGLTATMTAMNPPTAALSWVYAPANQTGFTIQRATNTGFTTGLTTFTAAATATSYTDATVVAGTTYYYRVRAFNGAFNSAFSNTATIRAQVAFVRVAAATPQAPTASVAVTYPGTQTAGNLNIVVVGWNNTTSNVQSVTDNKGNVYTLAVGPTNGTNTRQSIYYATAKGGASTTVTVAFTAAATYPDIRILEYSGVNTLDKTAGASGTGTSANSGTATTTAANELIFGAGNTFTSFTGAGTGFTSRIITSPDADLAEDRTVTAIGTYGATATLTSGAWVMQMATFK